MNQIYCPECESANPEEAVACSLCGHELQCRKPYVATENAHSAHRSWWTRPVVLGAGTLLLVAGVVGVVRFVSPATVLRDQTIYQPLYRTGKAITTATKIGVNQIEFGRLLQEFNTELSIAIDKVVASKSDLELNMVELYKRAAGNYGDSVFFREMRRATDNGKYHGGRIPVDDLAEAESIRAKYGIEFVEGTADYGGEKFYGFPLELPQLIWGKAAEHVAQAERIYLGQPEEP
jgi:hypothetical protein